MKKALSLILVLVMVCGLVACGSESSAVARYVEKKGDALVSTIESSFLAGSGMTCTSTVKAVGDGIVIDMNVNELEDLDPDLKEQMRESAEAMSGNFDGLIQEMQKELPELKYMTVNVNEKDGDNLFTFNIN